MNIFHLNVGFLGHLFLIEFLFLRHSVVKFFLLLRSVSSASESEMTKVRDHAAEQLNKFKNAHAKDENVLVSSAGVPVGNRNAVMTVGPRGPMLMQDVVFQDELAHFDRERIPERVVHAKGAGAHGYLEITNDITNYCKAALFSQVGKKTPLFVRFSTVGGESGSADTVRDPRGFAIKFYTEDGVYDLVGNNTPIFFIRDPILFPSFIHTQKRNPVTHLKDPDMLWDFITLRPETTHQVMFLFSDRGIPDGYRHMDGYGSHTFKLVNAKGEAVYCKFHMKTNQGNTSIDAAKAGVLSGSDPDYAIRDLYNAIEKGDFPSWNFSIQVMSFQDAEKFEWNPFDVTKVWPHSMYRLIPVGKLVLNKNPSNYFTEVEQSAFSPAHMVPGIEPSPDKMLQGRLFSYSDTHFHRLGANFTQLPINCPRNVHVTNYHRDGPMTYCDKGGAPNYHPNSFSGPTERESALESVFPSSGDVQRYNSHDEDNFSQPRLFWKNVLDEKHRHRLVENIAGHLSNAQEFIQERAVKNFGQVDSEFGQLLEKALREHKK